MLLFTNFDTRAGLERQLPVLRRVARLHRLVVVLFENTGVRDLLDGRAERLEDVYTKAVAEGLALEKREVARTLERHGIGALLTSPESLTVDAVNRYLQIKSARGVLIPDRWLCASRSTPPEPPLRQGYRVLPPVVLTAQRRRSQRT